MFFFVFGYDRLIFACLSDVFFGLDLVLRGAVPAIGGTILASGDFTTYLVRDYFGFTALWGGPRVLDLCGAR